nr:cell division protein FtsL [uncultured Dethiosulfovibrio sp.]
MIFKLITIALCLMSSVAWGWQDRYDSMVEMSLKREEGGIVGGHLKKELLSEAPSKSELILWKSLWEGSARERASVGLALIEAIYPQGDPSRWGEVVGFVYPSLIPRPLMAVDALMVSVRSLMDLEGGDFLAAELLRSFGSSSRAKHLFIDTSPKDMEDVLSELVSRTGMPGSWKATDIEGSLPLAAPVGGAISQSSAIARGMRFLDGSGVPSNNGPYGWDRSSGRIYQVVDRSNPLWIPGL